MVHEKKVNDREGQYNLVRYRLGTIASISLAWFLLINFLAPAHAEVYFYQGPAGEKLVSDRPPADDDGSYRLLLKRDTLSHAGHILAKRPISDRAPRRFIQYIRTASHRYEVDPALIEAVIQVESAFDPNAVSSKGATGLMQLMKVTAKQYQVKDRFNPKENIFAGVQHIRHLINRFDGQIPLVLAAYNAGATTVEKYNGIPPYPETRRYVTKVLEYHDHFRNTSFRNREHDGR